MTEHERNLFDLYAGLAMLGILVRHSNVEDSRVAAASFDMASAMLRMRKEIQPEPQGK